MKTIIETDTYPVRIVLVPETDEDRNIIKMLTVEFWDENSDTVVEYLDPDKYQDPLEVQRYGKEALMITAWCNLN